MKPTRMFTTKKKNCWLIAAVVCLSLICSAAMAADVQAAQTGPEQTSLEPFQPTELDTGFHLLYELKPQEARDHFELWRKAHPDDPLWAASEAASYLFEECYRQGVLTSEFFLDDKRFLGKLPLKPDPQLRTSFFAAEKQAQTLAQAQLKADPNNPNGLFAMALSMGMQADYASLIDKQQVESLKMIGESDKYAKKLLAISPESADAYLTLGAANYIVGSLPGIKRFFAGFVGVHGDKKAGIEQLQVAADHGHYLRPFAKIMLALAVLREMKPEEARVQLQELLQEFPDNTLFANELAKISSPDTISPR